MNPSIKLEKETSDHLSWNIILQAFRFAVVGGLGTIVNILVLFLFTEIFHIFYIISEIIAFIISSLHNFTLNKIWTFKEVFKEKLMIKYTQFISVSVISLFVNLTVLFMLVEYFGFYYILGELVAICVAFFFNFIGNKLWTFSRSKELQYKTYLKKGEIDKNHLKILIFIPTFNEKNNIGNLIDLINSLPFEKDILIVDDNSTDGTLEIIHNKQKKYRNIKLIIRRGEKGRGLAGITALNYFQKNDYNILMELDADFSHHPKYIPEFLEQIYNYDVIIGSRLVKNGGAIGRSYGRYILTLISNFIVRMLFQTNIKDCTSGFRMFRKEIINKFNLKNFISTHYSITEEILYACLLSKARIKEIPIIFYERASGKSKLNFKKIILTFLGIIRIILRGNKIIKANEIDSIIK
ncbi:MAG: GtrA family protein [Promethearchaeota archaeon]